MSDIEIYQKKNRLIIGGLAMAAFALGMVVLLVLGPNPDSIFPPFRSPLIFYPLGIVGLGLFAYFAWFAFKSLRDPRPRVVLSQDGVAVDGFSGRFEANWTEFSTFTLAKGSVFVLTLKDPEAFISRQPAGRAQQTARALSDRFGSPFLIETAMLKTDADTVRNALALRLPSA